MKCKCLEGWGEVEWRKDEYCPISGRRCCADCAKLGLNLVGEKDTRKSK